VALEHLRIDAVNDATQPLDLVVGQLQVLLQALVLVVLVAHHADVVPDVLHRILGPLLNHAYEDLGQRVQNAAALQVTPDLVALRINGLRHRGGIGVSQWHYNFRQKLTLKDIFAKMETGGMTETTTSKYTKVKPPRETRAADPSLKRN